MLKMIINKLNIQSYSALITCSRVIIQSNIDTYSIWHFCHGSILCHFWNNSRNFLFISLNRVSWGPYFHPQRELSVHGRVQTHSKQNLRVSIRRQLYGWRPSGTANVMCKVFSPPPKLSEELPSLVALQTWHAYSMKIKSRCYCFSRTSSIIFHIYSWFFIEFWRHCSCIIQRSIKNVFQKNLK